MNALPVRYWFSSVGGPRMFSTSRGVMPTSTLASGVLAGDATAARVGRSGSGALCAEHAISTDRNAIETKGTSLLPIPHLLSFATAVYAAVRRLAREMRCLRPMAAISSAPTCARSRSPYRQRAQRAFRRSLTPGSSCANTEARVGARDHHELHDGRVRADAVQLQLTVEGLRDTVANCVSGSSVFAMPSRSSRLSTDLRQRGDYEKTQTGARGAGGR